MGLYIKKLHLANMVPFLKEAKYEEGLFCGVKSIIEKLK